MPLDLTRSKIGFIILLTPFGASSALKETRKHQFFCCFFLLSKKCKHQMEISAIFFLTLSTRDYALTHQIHNILF